jgi:hypothetical protein
MEMNLDDSLLEEGEGSASRGGSSTAEGAGDGAAGNAGSGDKAGQTVPVERFQEVARQAARYRELGLDALADAFERDPKLRLRVLETVARGESGEPEPQRTPAPANQNAGREEFNRLYEQDKLAATTLVAKTVAEAIVDKISGPIEQLSVSQAINQFKAECRGALKDFAVVEPKFNQMVRKTSFKGLNAEQVQAALGQCLAQAYGLATLELRAKRQQAAGSAPGTPEPPNMGRSGAGDGTGSAVRLDPNDPAVLAARQMMKWGGLDDKEADAILER